jgi:excisionase family DNA binding protein
MRNAITTGDSPPPVTAPQPRFLTVGATARMLGMSEATLYRAIRECEFPAVKVRNRYVVPRRVLDALEDAALRSMTTVDAADWVERGDVA